MRLRNGDLLALLILLGLALRLADYPLWHTDVWGHAKYGRWILDHREFPEREPLSPYSDQKAKLIHFAWLSQVICAKTYDLGAGIAGGDEESQLRGGAEALRTMHFLMLMLRCTLFWLALRRVGGSANWAAVGLFLYVMAVGVGSAVQRPQAFGMLAFVAVLSLLSGDRPTWRTRIGLPVLFAVWANLHGTWVVGLAAFSMFAIGKAIQLGFLHDDTRRTFQSVFLSALACCLNPHGPAIYFYVVAFSGHPNLKTMTEWFPMQFTAGSGNHWPYLMSLVLLVMLNALSAKKLGWSGWLLALPLAAWPWQQERALLWWWTVVMWLIPQIGPGLAGRFPTMPSLPDGSPAKWRSYAMFASILLGISCIPAVHRMVRGTSVDAVVSPATPWRLALELTAREPGKFLPELRNALNGKPYWGAIFASETQGEFLIWHLPPIQPVLMFTHAHVFGQDHWTRALDVKFPEPDKRHRRYLREWQANMIVVERDTHAELVREIQDDAEWLVVDDGSTSNRFVAVRKGE
jgi:hypothetical protein